MSLINKLKNILFEEEEVEIPVLEKKEEPKSRVEEVRKSAPANNFFDDLSPIISDDELLNEVKEVSKVEPPKEPKKIEEPVNNPVRNEFRNERTFNFPDFDEEEFQKAAPKPRSTNVMEYERKKVEKKQEIKKAKKKEEVKDTTKFKPSPIISPVYGILDKNYTPDEITSRARTFSDNKTLDVDSVRKKAFGTYERKEEVSPILNNEEEIKYDDRILEEKLEKARTIDELLKDSSDDIIPVKDSNTNEYTLNNDYEEADNLEVDETFKNNEEVLENSNYEEQTFNDNTMENIEPTHEESLDDDTLESDLFDLIDSMYENREDGE
ncbi:MAG: hypothetical protein NC483_04305 [Ruminococcus sp.]|nr:hypothetical protein [Ruminococcus sp.]